MLSPGYSYDTAYVEFLSLEDAVRFMESNKVANPRLLREGRLCRQDYDGLTGLLVDGGGSKAGNGLLLPKGKIKSVQHQMGHFAAATLEFKQTSHCKCSAHVFHTNLSFFL